MPKARYIMIGGFLGAGKTTAVLRLAQHLTRRGLTVGLITNDQSFGLVDTALLGAHGFAVEEITGGCFCCKFNSLVEASERLSHQSRPDVFIAEPVGSCTDLLATVSYPLRRIYGDDFSVAPLSVLVDPIRARRILGLEAGRAFSSKVLYVYGKQLEEAEIIVINKCDLLLPARLQELKAALRERYPRAAIFTVSAREGTGLESWFDLISKGELGVASSPAVDYDLYAEGEALLGWLNCTLQLSAAAPLDGNALLLDLGRRIQSRLAADGLEIAHLKMTLTPEEDLSDIAVVNLVRTDGSPEMSHSLQESLTDGQLIINLRAEGDPESLRSATQEAVNACAQHNGCDLATEHIEHFRPARPVPTHRLTAII
ncbi:MAG: cobalamin biosynthesis protein P47K [Armatimonadota bacterium]|nr:cobalamin biosynthesis protein P47K [Armatimonadota bacterium]